MFGNNKKKDAGKTSIMPTSSSHSLNSLVQGTMVEGKVKATNDIRVDGSIKGDLICDSKVIIGPSGVVEGTIKCQNAVIEGRFEGTMKVKELLNIRESAKVTGDVTYGKLIVQSGAVISGSYEVAGESSNGAIKHATQASKAASGAASETSNISGKAKEFSKAN